MRHDQIPGNAQRAHHSSVHLDKQHTPRILAGPNVEDMSGSDLNIFKVSLVTQINIKTTPGFDVSGSGEKTKSSIVSVRNSYNIPEVHQVRDFPPYACRIPSTLLYSCSEQMSLNVFLDQGGEQKSDVLLTGLVPQLKGIEVWIL